MDYDLLLSGMTVRQFESLADNWYIRVKKLQSFAYEYNSAKAERLSHEMIIRLLVIQTTYFRMMVKLSTPRPKFRKGSIP